MKEIYEFFNSYTPPTEDLKMEEYNDLRDKVNFVYEKVMRKVDFDAENELDGTVESVNGKKGSSYLVRITSDCPIKDYEVFVSYGDLIKYEHILNKSLKNKEEYQTPQFIEGEKVRLRLSSHFLRGFHVGNKL